MKILGLIPARGGSKGIPRKNIRMLGGKPLLQWTAEPALACKSLHKVVLSTEDAEIAAVGQECGLEVLDRPAELSSDSAKSIDVVIHALNALDETYDAVCLLQPTDPFRKLEEIERCIEAMTDDVTGVITVQAVPPRYNPHWVYEPTGDGALRLATGEASPISRRQDLPPAFIRSGSVYLTRSRVLLEEQSFFGARVVGVEVPAEGAVNLDTMEDWEEAEAMLSSLSLEKES